MTTRTRGIGATLATPRKRPPYPGGTATSDGPIDWIAVDRAVAGERLPLNLAEAYHAARHMRAADVPGRAIAQAVGVSDRTVVRWSVANFPHRLVRPDGTLAPPTQPATSEGAPAVTSNDTWRSRAACQNKDPEIFFPNGTTGAALLQAERAKSVCAGCPVMEQCREWALTTRQEAGVWGGLDETERRRILRRRQRKAPRTRRVPAECGTRSGYKKHIREHTKICDECRAANSEYGSELYHRGKGKAAA